MSIPDLSYIVAQCKERYPSAWAQAHKGGPQTEDFIRIVAWECYKVDPRFGLNGKRGNPQDISDDVLCFKGYAAGQDYDPTDNNNPVTVIDVIAGAGGSNPQVAWLYPLSPSAAAWVKPQQAGTGGGENPPPPAPAKCLFQPTVVDLSAVLAKLDQIIQAQQELKSNELKDIQNKLDQISEKLSTPTTFSGSARFVGGFNGTVQGR